MTITTVSDQIYYAYANLAMADYAVSKGLIKYDRTCFMIRSRLYKGLQSGDMKIHSLFDDEKLKLQNGTRCVYMNGILYARSGKEINGFQNIKDEIKQLGIKDMVLDGELVRINRGNKIDDEDNFRKSLSIINSKERTDEEEDQIEYVLFDILPTSEIIKGK